MNPNVGNRGEPQMNFELPPQPAGPEEDQQQLEQAVEAPPARPETSGERPAAPALPAVPVPPAADQPVLAVPPQDAAAPVPVSQVPAKDTDHIEKEWVDKAKAIISKTQDDPYRQKNEMSRVKAEYIQKRFNKQIKLDDPIETRHSPEAGRKGEAAPA